MSEKMYIRVKKDGFIYPYNDLMAKNPECEVVTEQEAFPEKFIDAQVAEQIEKLTKPKRGAKKAALDLTTDISEEPVYTNPELASEAARGWPE